MKNRLFVLIILASLLLATPALGVAQEATPDEARVRRAPAPSMPQGDAANPWFARERAEPGAVITVTTTDDELNSDGDCSLREAIEAANLDSAVDACVSGSGDDTVLVPGGTYVLAIPGAGEDANQTGDLDILDNLVLIGDGAEVTILDGNQLDRIVQVHTGRTVEINDLTVTNGLVTDSNGSGIYNLGTLTLNYTTLRENEFAGFDFWGGALGNDALIQDATAYVNHSSITNNVSVLGGGLSNTAWTGLTAELNLSFSEVIGNSAVDSGGIYNGSEASAESCVSILTVTDSLIAENTASGEFSWGEGAGIYNIGWEPANCFAWMTMERSTVRDNFGANDPNEPPGHGAGAAVWNWETTTSITDSTISDNVVDASGDFSGHGGGLYIWDSDVSIINSTISGNSVSGGDGWGGGIHVDAGEGPSVLELINVTLADNAASGAGGAVTSANLGAGDPDVTFKNSIVSGNTAPEGTGCLSPDMGFGQASFTSLGNNLEDYDTCEFDEPSDLPNTDPLLGPLQDNGGDTETHALTPGSQAIDAGDDGAAPPADQRGVPRPQGPASDIGAYEAEAMHVGGIEGYFSLDYMGRPVLRMHVYVESQAGEPVSHVATDTSIWVPDGGPFERTRYTKPSGNARFHWGSNASGTWTICVDDLTHESYVYDPDANVVTCEDWYR